MNGRRLPYFDFDRSAITPTIGCITNPESGPAIHTSDVRLFVRPRFRRYGVQSGIPELTYNSQLQKVSELTSHFNTPRKSGAKPSASSTLRFQLRRRTAAQSWRM
jgi:hypothetical protein